VHEGGITVAARPGGGWRFARPDGREFSIPDRAPVLAHDWTVMRDAHSELGIQIDSDTAATSWRGERMDYELGVWVLCRQHERAQHERAQTEHATDADGVSAETPGWWASCAATPSPAFFGSTG
jgi:hypothetical protein